MQKTNTDLESNANTDAEFEILLDADDFIAVFKPAGWLTIPGRGNKEDVKILSHFLGSKLRGSTERSSTKPDLFTVHRLDEGTSGIVVFAKTTDAHRELSALFESREIKKKYLCLVKGTPVKKHIDARIFKIPSKKNKSVVDSKGKPSETKIETLISRDGFSLVEAKPLSGRSHQIRVHMAHIGHPIIGDKLYGGSTSEFGIEFQYPLLHAQALSFQLSSGQNYSIKAPLKGVFLETTNALKLKLYLAQDFTQSAEE
jgi:23S rRNA pseudouridine1911/1915/1917 synthase